jgi:hypothetical protein
MNMLLLVMCLAVSMLVDGSRPARVQAQEKNIGMAALGGVAGAGSGGYIAISVIVAESRAGKYMHSMKDALGWRSAPVLIGGVTGVVVGATSPDRLLRTMLYGSIGTLAGTGLGVVAGKLAWEGPEAKWAGGAIGAGIGMAIGSSLGLFLPQDKDEGEPGTAAALRIPLSFTIHF